MVFEYTAIIVNQLYPASFCSHKTFVRQRFIWCVEAIIQLNGNRVVHL